VGEWEASLPIPEAARHSPVAAARYVVDRIRPVLEPLHRPLRMQLSWAEYDRAGTETASHELEGPETPTWDAITAHLDRLDASTTGSMAVSGIFVALDTAVVNEAA